MVACNENILNSLLEIAEGYHGKDYYIMGEIPQKKLSASTAFHGVDPRDTVLVLLDSTIMGSAENGMSITLKGIHWKNMWAVKTRKTAYTWEELCQIHEKISLEGGDIIFEPGVQFSTPANYPGQALLNLIKALTGFFIECRSPISLDTPIDMSTVNCMTVSNPAALPVPVENGNWSTTMINSLALCACHSGKLDESAIDLAIEFLQAEDSVDHSSAIERLTAVVQQIEEDYKKSPAFLKLRQSKIIADCKPLSGPELEQLDIMIEAISDVVGVGGKDKVQDLWRRTKSGMGA